VAFFRDLFGLGRKPDAAPELELPPVPTSDDLLQKIAGIDADIDAKVAQGRVPDLVSSRVHRITKTARDVVPALDRLGAGSRDAHSVMATVTSYLPRRSTATCGCPRAYADRRPVDGAKTS
jgi:hypothetical protein